MTTKWVVLDEDNTGPVESPLIIGDGTGSPVIELSKTANGTAEVQFKVGTTLRWVVGLDSSENLEIRRYNSSGEHQDTIECNANVGGTQFPSNIEVIGEVVAVGGVVTDGLVAASDVDFTAAAQVRLPASSPLNTYTLSCQIKTIVSATAAVAYVAVPFQGAGEVMQIDVVPDAAIVDGAFTVTPSIVNVGIIDGAVISMSALTAAGTRGSGGPDPAASVIAGDVLAFTVGGGNTADGTATVTVTIRRAAIIP